MTAEEGNLQGKIESILFVAGEAVSIRDLARALQIEENTLRTELNRISDEYDFNQRGFMLLSGFSSRYSSKA